MTELLTAAEMRAIEQAEIESGAVTGLDLMERAGQGIVAALVEAWPGLADARSPGVIVLCGPGNNGGDGFVVARLLHGRGWRVRVLLYGEPDRLPPDARSNHDRWAATGDVDRLEVNGLETEEMPEIVLDAVFGTGLTRPVEGLDAVLARLRGWTGAAAHCDGRPKVVAVDIPSGLCSDSGRVLGDAGAGVGGVIAADLTVTFHTAKCGHYLAEGPAVCGRVVVKGIGL